MRRVQHDLVGRDELKALGVQVLVRDHVVAVAHLLQPVEEIEVRRQVAHPRAARVDVGEKARAEVQDRPEPRGVGDPAPVVVKVVRREPVLLMLVARPRARAPGADPRAILVVRDVAGDVRVDDVGERGHEHADVSRPLAPRRPNEERDHVLDVARLEPHGVDAAPEPLRHRVGEVRRPAAVVQVVVVEVDGAVLLRRVAPAHLAPRPVGPHHGARREVHQLAVEPVRSHVDRAGARRVPGEVPERDQVAARRAARLRELRRLERSVVDRRALDLPVVVAGHWRAAESGHQERRAAVEGGCAIEDRGGDARVVRPDARREGRLADGQRARGRVVGRPHAVPGSRQEGLPDVHRVDPAPAVPHQRTGAARVDEQREAGAACRVVSGDDALLSPVGQGRPDGRHQREAPEPPERRGIRHAEVGAERHRLDARGVVWRERRRNGLLLDAGPRGIRIARDQADQARLVRRRGGARHLEGDRLAWSHGEAIGVASQRKHGPPRRRGPARAGPEWDAVTPVSSAGRAGV